MGIPLTAEATPGASLMGAEAQLVNPSSSNDYGRALADAGDVNGDGYDDVVVGANGHAYVYFGSASGVNTSPSAVLSGPPGASAEFGIAVAGAGDVNGDGYDDVVVGDRGEEDPDSQYADGSAYVFLGSSAGLASGAVWTGDEPTSHYGAVVAGAGDVNGDGFDDLIVATPGHRADDAQRNTPCSKKHIEDLNGDSIRGVRGAVYLYLGSSMGLSADASWQKHGELGSCFGFSADGAGDVNGDGLDDIVVGELYSGWDSSQSVSGKGRAYVFRGTQDGVEPAASWSQPYPTTASKAIFGRYVAGAGDINGDGLDDILVWGRALGEAAESYVFAFFGTQAGLSSAPSWSVSTRDGLFMSTSEPVAVVGDADGDGVDDLIMGRRSTNGGNIHAWLYQGSTMGPIVPAAWSRQSTQQSFGHRMSAAGDVNGDGYADVVLGTDTQEVHVFYGGPNPPPVADAQSVSTQPYVSVDVSLTGSDPLGDDLIFAVETQPDHGTLGSLDVISGQLSYAPEPGFVGGDAFDFSVADPYGNADTATVTISVDSEAPRFVEPTPDGALQARVGEELAFRVNAEDPEGDDVSYGVAPMPSGASFDDATGAFAWTPVATDVGDYGFELSASDGYQTITRQVDVSVAARSGGDTADADAGSLDAGRQDAGRDAAADVGGDEDDGGDAGMELGADGSSSASSDGCGCRSTAGPAHGALALFVMVGFALWRKRTTTRARCPGSH